MKTIAILFCILIVYSNAINVRRRAEEQPNWQKRLSDFAETSQIAKTIVNSIQLGLSSKGTKVDEVIQFVDQALVNAQTERNGLKLEGEAEVGKLNKEIDGYTTQLDQLNTEQTQTNDKITGLNSDISYLETEIVNLGLELAALDEREGLLRKARDNDVLAFENRQRRDGQSIAALEQIIPALENLLTGGKAFLQKATQDIKFALNRIPENKPLTALVEVSTTFDPEQLGRVIEKLKGILEAIVKGKEDDATNEEASKTKYESLMGQIDSLKTQKYALKTQKKGELLGKKALLEGAESKLRNININIRETTNLKSSAVDLLATVEANYQRRVQQANLTVDALKACLQILTEGKEQLNAQEQSSTDTLASAQSAAQ